MAKSLENQLADIDSALKTDPENDQLKQKKAELEKKISEKEKKAELAENHSKYAKYRLERTGYSSEKAEYKLSRVGDAVKEVVLREDDAAELNSHKQNTLIEYVKL